MGYIKHDCVIAIVSDKEDVEKIERWRDSLDDSYSRYVLGPVEGREFGFTFFFAPDVGKEGHCHSANCDALREELIEIANQGRSSEVIHLLFGGDDYLTGIEEWNNGVKDIDFCLNKEELRELSRLKE